MLSRFMDRSVAWQLRAFAQEALHHTIGFGDHAWALRHPLAAAEQLRLADALCHWCRAHMVGAAPLDGISHYSILIRLAQGLRTVASGPITSDCTLQALSRTCMTTLPLVNYPDADQREGPVSTCMPDRAINDFVLCFSLATLDSRTNVYRKERSSTRLYHPTARSQAHV